MAKIRIAHISDPHFGTTEPRKISALTESLKSLNPSLIALSGDITQRARRQQFRDAKKFCESLNPIPLVVVPGNHDLPLYNVAARFFWPYFGYRRILGFPLSSRKNFGEVDIVGLNSTDPKRHTQGDLYKADVVKLKKFTGESIVRVAIFHHPMDCAKATDEENLLTNAQQALGYLEGAKIDLVLGGHIHDPYVRLSNARYPDAKRPLVIAVAGTCLSSRTRSGAPNSFNLIDIETKGDSAEMLIRRFDLSPTFEFTPVKESRFARENRDQWRTL